ncbi:MAG: rRNA maturation RNase YbeY [Christensenella sp.]|uniref:rRNA maturation RNase YbeY n=1 Tax=Christensenella sp. TaxID=1935934 RepID=UPI002B202C8B|nr:rRNA maturation RNase YbeY [Christensenella sp.]MEA5002396.1 rRNA maturation RNase YbeY [Christensenella sp.]
MKIIFSDEQKKIEFTDEMRDAIKRTLEAAQCEAGMACCVNILLTDNEGIRDLNSEFRDIDKETDVLSFPAYELSGLFAESIDDIDLEYVDEDVFLGDIAISLPRAQQQAEEYGHSLVREMAFLALHGTLHLLGYDHMTPEEEACMTQKQREILESVSIGR